MKKLPKNCLTCKFMAFIDDELEEMRCYNLQSDYCGTNVQDDYLCDLYKLNELVLEDAKQGCL